MMKGKKQPLFYPTVSLETYFVVRPKDPDFKYDLNINQGILKIQAILILGFCYIKIVMVMMTQSLMYFIYYPINKLKICA